MDSAVMKIQIHWNILYGFQVKWTFFFSDFTCNHGTARYYIFKISSAATTPLRPILRTKFGAKPDQCLNFCSEATFPSDSSCLPPPIHTNCLFTSQVAAREPGVWAAPGTSRAAAPWPPRLLVYLSVGCSLPFCRNFRNTKGLFGAGGETDFEKSKSSAK